MVRKLELSNKQKDLIKKSLIKSKLYSSCTLELDELVKIVTKKSALFLSTLTDDAILEKFLEKTAEKVLSKYQKPNSAQNLTTKTPVQEEKTEEPNVFQLEDVLDLDNEKTQILKQEQYTEEKIIFDVPCDELPTLNPEKLYEHVEDPKLTNKVKKVPADVANKILDILTEASTVHETKDYIKIFYLKYIKKLKQAQIAKKMHISEIELSQKYFDMVKYVKEKLYS